MEQILRANDTVLRILRKPKVSSSGYRMLKYCVSLEVETGYLLFNTLTREMVLLTNEEYETRLEQEYLKNRWFVVPEDINEKEYVGLIRMLCAGTEKKSGKFSNYTIFTTMDCNARCYYCYELGRNRTPMSEENAHKAARYIIDHYDGKKVRITWYGGEPLYNAKVIDIICSNLRENNINFESKMISNGYLFDDETVTKAKKDWNLSWIQITLDGTETVYNRSKAFIYKEGSAYQIVLNNIARLQNAGIYVAIRMNMGLKNAEDLSHLLDELNERFPDKTGLSTYSYLLFDLDKTEGDKYSDLDLDLLYNTQFELQNKMIELRFAMPALTRIKDSLRMKHCMADNATSLVISSSGNLSRCDHYPEQQAHGNLDVPKDDSALIADWQVYCDEIPECEDCYRYPECIRLKNCTHGNHCHEHSRRNKERNTKRAMLHEYLRWRDHIQDDTAPDWD